MLEARYARIGMIARWRPVHLGHSAILRVLCQRGGEVLIGIGSSNRYNLRNPFTLEETQHMIELVLSDFRNYRIIAVPDLDDGPRWRGMVREQFGALDLFVTENPYVTSLLKDDYRIARPIELILPEEQIPVDGSRVRRAMARGEDWESLVPKEVAEYIKSNQIDLRFRQEFGLQTLAMITVVE